jgi:hypothetical protein
LWNRGLWADNIQPYTLKTEAAFSSEKSVSTAMKTSDITEIFYRISLLKESHCTVGEWYQGFGRTS